MVPEGKADVMLSFEPVEALRYINYLKEGGMVVVNTKPIVPVQVSMGMASYPSLEEIRKVFEEEFKAKWIGFNAEELAEQAGHVVTTNTVLIGALTQIPEFPLDAEHVREVIKITIPPKAVDINMKAFDLGIKAAKEILGL